MTSKKYAVHWKSKITDKTGHGTGRYTYEKAEQIAKSLNANPDSLCVHWAAIPETEAQS